MERWNALRKPSKEAFPVSETWFSWWDIGDGVRAHVVTIQRREDWFQDSWIRLKVWQIFWKFITKLSFSWLHNCQKLPCQREMAWHSDKDKFFADCNLIWVAIKVFDCKKAKIIFVHISHSDAVCSAHANWFLAQSKVYSFLGTFRVRGGGRRILISWMGRVRQ